MRTPVTREKIQNHMTYSAWKYILLAVAAIFGWNIIYSMTQYQPPEEKKIVMGVYSFGDGTNIDPYTERIRTEVMPDMEEISAQFIMPDETYGDMILTARIAARECDIYVLPRTQFQNYAAQGAFMPLDELLPELVAQLEEAGISLSRGFRTNDEIGEKHQYGIPLADLPGAMTMLMCDTRDMYICVFMDTGNDANVLRFVDLFVRDLMIPPENTETPAA